MEQFSNYAPNTTAASITDVATSLVVADGSLFPATGTFRVRVDNEIMLVTARASDTLTVTRGTEGTVAAAHASGVSIRAILSAAAIAQLKLDIRGWKPPPVAADWTKRETGTNLNIIDQDNAAFFRCTTRNVGRDATIGDVALPAPPYDLIVGVVPVTRPPQVDANYPKIGLALYETATSKFVSFGIYQVHGQLFHIERGSFLSGLTGAADGASYLDENYAGGWNLLWFRITDVGGGGNSRSYYLGYGTSPSDVNWVQFAPSESSGQGFTTAPNRIGLIVDAWSVDTALLVRHWAQSW